MDVHHQLHGTSLVWNADKACLNARKHGIPFEQAAEVFFDPFFRLVDACRSLEARAAAIGFDREMRLLCVVHVVIEGEVIRVISARRATRPERATYDS